MTPISNASIARTLRARQVILVLVLLACSSSLQSSQPAQAIPLTVLFSPTSGTFVGSETVTLTVQARAEIHYTLDGSIPTVMSPIYREPIPLDKSTRLRAVAIVPGASTQGPVATETYLRVDPDTRSFTSHLPIILIHTFESGRLDSFGTEHVAAALQVLEPSSGSSHIIGRAALDARIGIHVRGATSRNFPKKQYAVELRADDSDDDRAQPLLGLPSEADWVLSDPVPYDRTLIRNALAFEMSRRIARYAPRTRFAEVFLVDDGGDVRAANFLGFYTLIEKIDRDNDRVDVSRGGYILRIDKGFPDFFAAGERLQFVYPDPSDMASPERRAELDAITAFINDFGQAVRAPDFRHPSTGQHYSAFIDVDAWIDHHILNVLTKNVDGLRFSSYFYKDRDGRLAAGPVWDFDRSLGTPYDWRATEPEEWTAPTFNTAAYFDEGWWGLLFRDPEFRSRYRRRFATVLDVEFAPDNLDRIVDGMASQVGGAAERDFRRWAQFPPLENSYAAEIELLKDFLRRRANWIKTRLEVDF